MDSVRPRDPVADLIRAAFREAVTRIGDAESSARRYDVEGVHRLRTATRRLRSVIHTLSDSIEPACRERLEGELRWLAGVLGNVRDLDILMKRLGRPKPDGDAGVARITEDPLVPIFDSMRKEHGERTRLLGEALQSARYRELRGILTQFVERPELGEGAEEACRTALPPLAATSWRRLGKKADRLTRDAPDGNFHLVRKRAKQARYTAEIIAPALGGRTAKRAQRYIQLTTLIQDVLGEHQDAVVAVEFLERFLADHPHSPELETAARRLIECQQEDADASRGRFFKIWPKLDRKKRLSWLKAKV